MLLQLPDYTAAERTLPAAAAGPGSHWPADMWPDRLFVQITSQTTPAIADAAAANWPDFYKRELSDRKSVQASALRVSVKVVRTAGQQQQRRQGSGSLCDHFAALKWLVLPRPPA